MPITYPNVVLREIADMRVNQHGSEKGKIPHLSAVSALEFSAQKIMARQVGPDKATKIIREIKYFCHKKRLRELGFSLN